MARSARNTSIAPTQIQIVHAWNRFVRRAFLCGFDPVGGRCFEHRRLWARQRLEHLASLFAIDCLIFSIMSKQTLNDGTYSYVYDAEGNRVLRIKLADNSYEVSTYDHRNRLTKVSFRNSSGVEQKSVSYTYDIYNRMVRRRLDSNGPVAGGITDEYFAGFDGINPSFEFTKTNPGSGLTESDLSNRYLWGPAVDQLFADEQISTAGSAGNTLWPLADQVGTLKDIVDFDSVGNAFSVVNHRTFDSFGNITAESNASIDLAFSYTGKFLDGETQLSYHWNRWYDPGLGKWVSEDPIGFSAGDANLGRYVMNSVLAKVDSNGLQEKVYPGSTIQTRTAPALPDPPTNNIRPTKKSRFERPSLHEFVYPQGSGDFPGRTEPRGTVTRFAPAESFETHEQAIAGFQIMRGTTNYWSRRYTELGIGTTMVIDSGLEPPHSDVADAKTVSMRAKLLVLMFQRNRRAKRDRSERLNNAAEYWMNVPTESERLEAPRKAGHWVQ